NGGLVRGIGVTPDNLSRRSIARNAARGKHDGAAPAWNGRRPIPVRPRAGGHPGQTCWPHERAGPPPAPGPTAGLAPGVRLALRIDDLLELAEHVHAGQQLLQARVRLALLLDGGDELAVLELDAVHRDVNLRHIDLVVLAVGEIVVERLVGAVVADVAE